MGISSELFLEAKIDDEFLCSICQDVLEKPTMLEPCEHAFCNSCIEDWRKNNSSSWTCPMDRQPITGLKTPPRLFMNLLNKLEVRCPFHVNGCGVTMQLEIFLERRHEAECELNPVNPKDCAGGCGAILTLAQRQDHNCIQYLKDELHAKQLECTRLKNSWELTKSMLEVSKIELELERCHKSPPRKMARTGQEQNAVAVVQNGQLQLTSTVTSQPQVQPSLAGPHALYTGEAHQKAFQERLKALYHAWICWQRAQASGGTQQLHPHACTLQGCGATRTLLAHIKHCTGDKDCVVKHCFSTRKIVQHFKQCKKTDCGACSPLKRAMGPPGPGQDDEPV